MNGPLLTTVTVTYNSGGTLSDALSHLRRLYEEDMARVVLVDNGSADGTPSLLRSASEWACVVLGNENIGFARGCNRGLSEVSTPYTLFLNPDAALGVEAARTLVAFMERTPRAGACGPAILQGHSGDPEPYQTAGRRPTPWSTVRRLIPGSAVGSGLQVILPGAPPFRCEWVCGAGYLIRTALARELGGFDPRFFLYFDEIDLSLRAERAGWEIWAVGEALMTHVGAASAPRNESLSAGCISRFFYPSRMYYFTKHHGIVAAVCAELGEIVLLGVSDIIGLARKRYCGKLRERLKGPVLRMPQRVC
ncbi:MAG: glycosyltransferase family 2 protein [Candidatus Hydrogenedentes bacterium]|nr:glycosyltransferase family 2 protein [Candidatus Hydrogenedentota bacterium]